jgi:hypothetical protein
MTRRALPASRAPPRCPAAGFYFMRTLAAVLSELLAAGKYLDDSGASTPGKLRGVLIEHAA